MRMVRSDADPSGDTRSQCSDCWIRGSTATSQPPAGWAKQAKDDGLIYTSSNKQKNTFAMVVLYHNDLSSGDPKRDFDADWRQFVVGAFKVTDKPQMDPQKQAGGWTVVTGQQTSARSSAR